MSTPHPVIPGAEAWSSPGTGAKGRIGIAVIHGITGNPHSTRPLAEKLAKRGYAVEVPRLPGHGTHWADLVTTRYRDWRAEVSRVANVLRQSCDRVVLVGQSMGGTLSIDVASDGIPRVAGVVTINPILLDRAGLAARLGPLLSRFVPVVPAKVAGLRRNDAARPGANEKAYTLIPTRAAQSLLSELPHIRQRVRQLRLPVLAAYSPTDHCVAPENSTALPKLVSGEVTLVALQRSYHLATLDHDRDLLEAEIAAFSDRVSVKGC